MLNDLKTNVKNIQIVSKYLTKFNFKVKIHFLLVKLIFFTLQGPHDKLCVLIVIVFEKGTCYFNVYLFGLMNLSYLFFSKLFLLSMVYFLAYLPGVEVTIFYRFSMNDKFLKVKLILYKNFLLHYEIYKLL